MSSDAPVEGPATDPTARATPRGHLVDRGAVVGETHIPGESEFAAMARDGRGGSAVSDMVDADEPHHQAAADAVCWDEETNPA